MNFKSILTAKRHSQELDTDPIKIWDYVLVFLLVATSGIVYFYYNEEYIVIGLIISLMIAYAQGMLEKIELKFVLILITFALVGIFQSFYFESFSIKTILGTLQDLHLLICNKECRTKFISTYINLIYFFSIISLIILCSIFLSTA